MKAYLVWLKIELKRVVKRLPSLFIGAIVLTILVGAIAFCAFTVMHMRGQYEEIGAKVAVVAPEDELTNLALSFVAGMDSVEEWCSFDKYSLEDGLKALGSKEVVAVIVLPEDVVKSILNGTNIPAQLYLPKGEELGSTLLEIMAEAGVSLLQVAQGEIYATTDLYMEYPFTKPLSELYGEINLYNLNIALNREHLFKTIALSETEGISMGAYYGGTALSVFVLLFGLLLADLMVEHTRRERLLSMSRVTIAAQVIGRLKVLTLVSFLWTFVLSFALATWINGDKKSIVMILRWCVQNSISLLLAVACVVAIYLLLGTLIREKMSYMFTLGLGMLVLGYVGGYFVPSSLLGQTINGLGYWLPTTYLHDVCSGLLAGQDMAEVWKRVDGVWGLLPLPAGDVCMLVWLAGSLTLCILLRRRRDMG